MPVRSPPELQAFLKGLGDLADGKHREAMSTAMGAELLALVKEGFDKSQAPDGTPWAPVARGGQPLRDTGRLRNAFMVSATAERIVLENGSRYVATHQYGATIHAVNAPFLVFKGASFRTHYRGSANLLKRGAMDSYWASVKQVTIKQRQMVPEDTVPDAWAERLADVADLVMRRYMEA